ncbi:MAG: cytochrome c oxidase assembly protein [Acidimicrobiales bacterium]
MLSAVSPFHWRDATQFALEPGAIALMVLAAALYAWGQHRTPNWPRSRSLYFALGLIVTFVATESVIGLYDRAYFSDHMIQHLLLIMVAAPLFALATPLDLAYRAGSTRLRAVLDSRPVALVTEPIVAFGLYFVFIPVSHLTGLYNEMLLHEWIHQFEHLGFLIVGYLFFRVAFGLERGHTIHPGLRLVFVMAAVPVDTFTGLALAMSSHNPFSAYRTLAPIGSTPASVLANVQLGGAIMWIGGDALMLLACIPIAVAWVRWETRRTVELDARLDAEGR